MMIRIENGNEVISMPIQRFVAEMILGLVLGGLLLTASYLTFKAEIDRSLTSCHVVSK